MIKESAQTSSAFLKLPDRSLATYFENSASTLEAESVVLGAAIRSILLTGTDLSNKAIIIELVYALELTEDASACDVIRNTLEIVVGFTKDDF